MVSKGKEYRVYGWHPGNLPRCLNTYGTYERADQFAKTMKNRVPATGGVRPRSAVPQPCQSNGCSRGPGGRGNRIRPCL